MEHCQGDIYRLICKIGSIIIKYQLIESFAFTFASTSASGTLYLYASASVESVVCTCEVFSYIAGLKAG